MPGLRRLYDMLLAALGPQDWWPANGPFEMMIGAVLTQNTAWANVEHSVHALDATGLLSPEALVDADPDALRALIAPSGFMTAKAATCLVLARWVITHRALDAGVSAWTDAALRDSLLGLRGVGPETADAIMLYAFDRPVFVWDAYARRLLARAGYTSAAGYEATRRRLEPVFHRARFTLDECQELHGLIDEAGKKARRDGWDWLFHDSRNHSPDCCPDHTLRM
ncbi:MAG: hypothetical protein FWF75_03860 [Propionibacteriaceae bacterium]|nr:hypothetical protein [Propionibacteriaceae bacterium]